MSLKLVVDAAEKATEINFVLVGTWVHKWETGVTSSGPDQGFRQLRDTQELGFSKVLK